MVRIHPDPPGLDRGAVAQLGEHLLCKQGVVGSIPSSSTNPGITYRLRTPAALAPASSLEEAASSSCTLFNNSEGKALDDLMRVVKRLG